MTSAATLVVLLASVAAADYCSLSTCPGKPERHTMCEYPDDEPADSCSNPREGGVDTSSQQVIISAINSIRTKVKDGEFDSKGLPLAASMPNMTWDQELADIAQHWANQCSSGHDECRDVERFRVGQNVALTSGHEKDWQEFAVNPWFYGELDNFEQDSLVFRSTVDPVSGKIVGHLTQLIWANTTHVGCGYLVTDAGSLERRTYVCNFGPAGNILNQTIYTAVQASS